MSKIHEIVKFIPNTFKNSYRTYALFMREYEEYLNGAEHTSLLQNISDYTLKELNVQSLEYANEHLYFTLHENAAYTPEILRYINQSAGTIDALKAYFKLSHNDDVNIQLSSDVIFKLSNTWHSSSRVYTVLGVSDRIESVVRVADGKSPFIERQIRAGNITILFLDSSVVLNENETLLVNNTTNAAVGLPYVPDFSLCTNMSVGDYVAVFDGVITGEYQVTSTSKGGVATVNITSAGTSYEVGDKVLAVENTGFFATVTHVGVNGEVAEVTVTSEGRFKSLPTLYIKSVSGVGCELTAVSTTIGRILNYRVTQPNVTSTFVYSNTTGTGSVNITQLVKSQVVVKQIVQMNNVLGSNNYIIDSLNLHEHSYKILTKTPYYLWKDVVDKHFHRYGFKYTVSYTTLEVFDTMNNSSNIEAGAYII